MFWSVLLILSLILWLNKLICTILSSVTPLPSGPAPHLGPAEGYSISNSPCQELHWFSSNHFFLYLQVCLGWKEVISGAGANSLLQEVILKSRKIM